MGKDLNGKFFNLVRINGRFYEYKKNISEIKDIVKFLHDKSMWMNIDQYLLLRSDIIDDKKILILISKFYCQGFSLIKMITNNNEISWVLKKIDNPIYIKDKKYSFFFKKMVVGKDNDMFLITKVRVMLPYLEYGENSPSIVKFLNLRPNLQYIPFSKFLKNVGIDKILLLKHLFTGKIKLFGYKLISYTDLLLMDKNHVVRRNMYKPGIISISNDEISESKYFDDYDKYGLLTDIRYLFKRIINKFTFR